MPYFRLLLLGLLFTAAPAGAQTTYTWVGSAGQWNTAANWSPAGVPGPGDTAVITAFGSEVELTSDVTVAGLTLSRRLFSALGDDLTITDAMAWSGGTVSLFAATLTIEAGATLELTGSVVRFAGFLFNYGTITHAGATTDLVLESGAGGNVGAVANFGLYDVTSSTGFAEIRGAGTFLNGEVGGVPTGVFRKSGTGSPFIVSCYDAVGDQGFTNRGLVEVEAGELRFDNAASLMYVGHGASFTGASGTALWINMRYREDLFEPSVSISGFDRVRLGQQMTYTGALDTPVLEIYENDPGTDPDTTDVTGAAISNLVAVEVTGNYNALLLDGAVAGTLDTLRVRGFGSAVTFTPGGPFGLAELVGTGSGSLLDFGGTDVRADTISLSSDAHLFGIGDLALAAGGGMRWENGDVTVAGTFTVEAGARVAMSISARAFTGTLENDGTFSHTGNSASLTVTAGSVFRNNGTYDLASTGQFGEIRGDGAFVNDGLFVKRGAATSDDVRLDFTNNGTLDVREDALHFDEAFTNGTSGVVMGDGALDVTSATAFTNDGTFAPGASPGLLDHWGDFTMSGVAVLAIELDGLAAGTEHDQLAVDGDAALGGTLRLVSLGTYLPGLGDSYTVLTATGTVTGAFGAVEAPAGYAFDVTYDAGSVVATVVSVPNFDLTAVNTSPLTVPPGGQVSFSYTIANNTASTASGDFYFTASGGYQGIIVSGSLDGGQSFSGAFTQNVPASVPPGTYNYTLRIGSFPGGGVDAVPFTITVVAPRTAQGDDEAVPGADAWTVTDATPWPSPEALAASETGARGTVPEAAEASSALPEAFALHAAAPNPFASRTTLRYDLPEAADVTVEVLDLLGRRVAVLVDAEVEAGAHVVAFEASSLPSGVYLVRMTAGAFAATQRLTRVR